MQCFSGAAMSNLWLSLCHLCRRRVKTPCGFIGHQALGCESIHICTLDWYTAICPEIFCETLKKKMTATKIHDKWQNNHIHKFCHLTLVNMSSVSLSVFSFFRMRLKNMIVIYAFWTKRQYVQVILNESEAQFCHLNQSETTISVV